MGAETVNSGAGLMRGGAEAPRTFLQTYAGWLALGGLIILLLPNLMKRN